MVKPIYGESTCFSTFSNNKSKSCGQNHTQCLFVSYFSCKAQIIAISCGFNLISNSWQNPRWRPRWRLWLVTSQASSSATAPKIYLILLRRSKAFHRRWNRFKLLQYSKNSGEGFHPPPPPIPRLGYEFACTSEGKESAVIGDSTFSLISFVRHWTWFVCTYFNEGCSWNMMHDPRSMFYSLRCIVVDLFIGGREV